MVAPLVIIGSGLAGYNLAREVRKLDTRRPLLLITADDGHSYSKPLLSLGFAMKKEAGELGMFLPGSMAVQLDAEVRTRTRVTRLEPASRRLWIGTEPVAYEDLVLAWGAQAIRVPVAGDADEAIFSVNDLEDYARFREALRGKRRVLVMGAGLIGCEFANDLLQGGYEVDVVAPSAQLMPTLLPEPAAAVVQRGLEAQGVRFHLGTSLARLDYQADGLRAQLADGRVLTCDAVLSAVGLRPRIELAAAAGLAVGRGIQVNRLLQTSAAHVHALGDCAEVEGLNLLYVMPLMSGVRALAHTLTGKPTPVSYGPMPVSVKTPACPLVVAAPPAGRAGRWHVEANGNDVRALFRDEHGSLLGYALTGKLVEERLIFNKQLPAMLPDLPQILSFQPPS